MADISNAYWSETDAGNNSAAPNGWPPGTMLPSDVEPTGQMMMGATKRFWDRMNAQVTTTGSAGSYVYLPTNVAYPTAIVQGEVFGFVAHHNSAGNDTFTINGTTVLGPYNIYVATQAGGIRQIKAGEIIQNQMCAVQYSSAAGGMVLQAVAQPYGDGQKYVVAGGSADAWTAAVSVTSLFDGMELLVKFPQANATTTPTINVNSLGAKTIGGDGGVAINAGDIAAGSVRQITYDATLGKFTVFLGNSVASAQVSASAAHADRVAADADAAAAHADRVAADTDAAAAHSDRLAADTDAANALNYSNIATTSAATSGVYANAAASNVPQGLTQASVGTITGGSGGTNGTFNLSWSGGNFSVNPTGTFTVAGNVLTAVTITGPGLYIGGAPTIPTPSFAASAGLTGASVALTIQYLVTSGNGYWVQSTDGQWLNRYKNVSGVATADSSINPVAVNYFKTTTQVLGTTTVLTTSGHYSSSYIQVPYNPTTNPGYLETVSFRASGIPANTICIAAILVFELVGGTQYKITKDWRVQIQNGLNTFKAPDIDNYYVPIGSLIGAAIMSGMAAPASIDIRAEQVANSSKAFAVADLEGGITSATYGSGYHLGYTPSLQTGDPTTWTPMLSYTLVHFDQLFNDDFTSGMSDLLVSNMATKATVANVSRGKTSINRTFFPGVSTPPGWNLGGATVNNGLSFTTPGTSSFARYDTNSAMNYGGAVAKFKVTDTAAQFGIGWTPQGTEQGGYIEIDGTGNLLKAMQWVGTGNAPSDISAWGRSVSIPALVSGHVYTLTTRRRGFTNEIVLIDNVTQAVTTLTTQFYSSTFENFNGRPGFLHRTGSASGVTCLYFEHYAMFERPKIVVLGDSNAYGAALDVSNFMRSRPISWQNAWPYLLDAQRGRGDVLNASRPGEDSTGLAGRLAIDLNLWSPDFVVIAIGTNDPVQATWRTNVQTIINAVLARGATPVLCTFPPRADRQAFLTAANADIRSGYFGAYPYIDFAFALTSGNDSVTWNPAFSQSDGVHANILGHAAMFIQAQMDAPFLLLA